MGAATDQWYFAGRDHLFFALEGDIHHGRLRALGLPQFPPAVRERLSGDRHLAVEPLQRKPT
jgi:hypothetical protein